MKQFFFSHNFHNNYLFFVSQVGSGQGPTDVFTKFTTFGIGYSNYCLSYMRIIKILRGGAVGSAREAHNLEAVGSNQAPATKISQFSIFF